MTLQPAKQRADVMHMEIDVLRNELRKRDLALNSYDCQYQQLMVSICHRMAMNFMCHPVSCLPKQKTKAFKKSGYRYLDDLIENCCDSCVNDTGIEDNGDITC